MASSSRRGRPPKDSKRMDAALKVLLPIFPKEKEKIIDTINSLLKVYGKEAGWFFVEDNGTYQTVMEAIFNEEEEKEEEKKEENLPPPSQEQHDLDNQVSPQRTETPIRVNQAENSMMDESSHRTNPNHISPQVDSNTLNQEAESTIDECLSETDSPRRVRSPSFGYLSQSMTDYSDSDHSSL